MERENEEKERDVLLTSSALRLFCLFFTEKEREVNEKAPFPSPLLQGEGERGAREK